MPDRWQKFAVLLVGVDDPIEVQTNARDWAQVKMDPAAGVEVGAITFQVVHLALVRNGVDVPRDYDAFLDVLDGMPEVIEGEPPALDPTRSAASVTAPS
jgi:hypothetical protein